MVRRHGTCKEADIDNGSMSANRVDGVQKRVEANPDTDPPEHSCAAKAGVRPAVWINIGFVYDSADDSARVALVHLHRFEDGRCFASIDAG